MSERLKVIEDSSRLRGMDGSMEDGVESLGVDGFELREEGVLLLKGEVVPEGEDMVLMGSLVLLSHNGESCRVHLGHPDNRNL